METPDLTTMIVGGVMHLGAIVGVVYVLYRYHAPDYDEEDDDDDDSYHI
jgi:hypothetical protein